MTSGLCFGLSLFCFQINIFDPNWAETVFFSVNIRAIDFKRAKLQLGMPLRCDSRVKDLWFIGQYSRAKNAV